MLDGTFDTQTTIQNTTNTNSYSLHLADLKTKVDVFNQSNYFKKTAVSLTEITLEINGTPVYPSPQSPDLIKNNNFDALDMSKYGFHIYYGFLMATSSRIASGYSNPTSNLLNIKYSTTCNSSAADKVYLLAFAERVVRCKFSGSSVSIEMQFETKYRNELF
jgi:hypothetical protein